MEGLDEGLETYEGWTSNLNNNGPLLPAAKHLLQHRGQDGQQELVGPDSSQLLGVLIYNLEFNIIKVGCRVKQTLEIKILDVNHFRLHTCSLGLQYI